MIQAIEHKLVEKRFFRAQAALAICSQSPFQASKAAKSVEDWQAFVVAFPSSTNNHVNCPVGPNGKAIALLWLIFLIVVSI